MIELPKSHNLNYLSELKRLVESDEERYFLIGLSIYLGSYNARKELGPKGFFKGRKDTLSRMYESSYIARQQEEILSRLSEESPKSLISNLKKKIEDVINNDDICESDLSKCIRSLEEQKVNLPLYEIGKRVEKRLMNLSYNKYNEYKLNKNERTLCDILYREEEAIRHAVVFEVNR